MLKEQHQNSSTNLWLNSSVGGKLGDILGIIKPQL